jgi:hypothetical protein
LKLTHYRVDDTFDAVAIERPLAQSDVDRAGELVAIERLTPAVLLDYRQLAQPDAFEGGEPRAAVRTSPAAANHAAIVARPRVLDLAVIRAAERTSHALFLLH